MDHIKDDCQCVGKVCKVCDVLKCLNAFGPDKKGIQGRLAQCKVCRNEILRRRYHENIEDRRAYNRVHYHRHKEQYLQSSRERYDKEQQAAYYQRNREAFLLQQKAYRLENAEKVKQSRKAEYERHKDAYLARSRKQRQENPKLMSVYAANYRRRHPDIKTAQKQRRRAAVAKNGGSFTKLEWQALKEQYEYACLCCGRKEPEIKLCADHVVPITKGGSSHIDNIQPLCKSCNSKKHNKIIDYR